MLSFKEFIQEGTFIASPIQPWCPIRNHDPDGIYDVAVTKVTGIRKKFENVLKRVSGGVAKVLTDIKSKKSFMDKITRGKNPCAIHDLLRGAVLCKDDAAVEDAVKQIRKTQQWHEIEGKSKGDNAFGYYGSYHLKIVIDGIICEVQVMTQRLWTYKEWGHEIYNQTRQDFAKTGHLDPALVSHSKRIFDRGNKHPYFQKRHDSSMRQHAESFCVETYGPMVQKAQQFAIQAHGDQKYGEFGYSKHLQHVVNVLHRFHRDSPTLLAAAWLHDTVEDTKVSIKMLKDFPSEVVAIVDAVSDPKVGSRSEKKAASYPKIRRIPNAIILKLADRIANVEVGGKLSKYRFEHEGFRKALYVPGMADDMWMYLDGMLSMAVAA